ncbi:MAG: carboxylating nicotinate-nucleotide diphosphorylase [Alphaproteobacteria bacterium]|nr:carboxylating nicotinate-nucleotide diphosphorylase [Alphaproteobacteria bacterium]
MLHLREVERIVQAALAEDIGHGDITSDLLIPESKAAKLAFTAREALVVAGVGLIASVYAKLHPNIKIELALRDGVEAKPGDVLARVEGPARACLLGERVALNLLQRVCGVATMTRAYVKAVEGTGTVILDTRKTMPGLRELDKYAVLIGGGRNHRMRLDDGVLIKDNHIALAGGIAQAVARARAGTPVLTRIEVECDTLDQVKEALQAGADMLLLDNMDTKTLREAVKLAKGKALIEASGNMALERVREVAETGVEFISVGRLTHSCRAVDIGLDIE